MPHMKGKKYYEKCFIHKNYNPYESKCNSLDIV
jgi:hypothetical protein